MKHVERRHRRAGMRETAPVKIDPKPGEPTVELYNLKTDPHEDKNVYDSHPQIVARLSALLKKYQDSGRSVSSR